jgi:glycosyltransferase involved in cell wall biosynthesis
MRLLHVTDRFGWTLGGADRYMEELLGHLKRRDIENVVVYHNGNPERLWLADRAIEIRPLMQFRGRVPAAEAELARVIADTRPDAALVYCLPNAAFGVALVREVPTLLVAQDYGAICLAGTQWLRLPNTACDRTTGPSCLIKAFTDGCCTRRPLRLADWYYHGAASRQWLQHASITTVSAYMRNRFLSAGYREERVHVVRHGFPSDLPMPDYPIDVDVPTVLFVGRVSREKGVDHLLRALAQIQHLPWRLFIAGDGPNLAACKRLATDLGLDERVTFAGWITGPQLEQAYAQASLVVVPSLLPDPSPLVGPDAMLRGRPVVGYASGGIPEWIVPGETGRLVEPGDITGLASALGELLAHPSVRAAMGARARAWVVNTLTLEKHLHSLLDVIARTVASHSPPIAGQRLA